MRTFVLREPAKGELFWCIDLRDRQLVTIAGKVGTRGKTKSEFVFDEKKAQAKYAKLVDQKAKEGYTEVVEVPPPPPSADRLALEAGLAANPDEVAAHSAYADYLTEHDDPRGAFVQIQLALEDESLKRPERAALAAREKELQAAHERAWLGDLARFLVGDWSGPGKPYHFAFRRGWLDAVRVLPFPHALVGALARAPEVRLLRRLEIVYDMEHHPHAFDEFTRGPAAAVRADEKAGAIYDQYATLPPLLDSPHLGNLRVFKLGFSDDGERLGHSTMVDPFDTCTAEQVIGLLEKWPRLEELYLNTAIQGVRALFASPALGNLRVLQYYYGFADYERPDEVAYPLAALAKNKALANLHTLRLHPGRDATVALEDFVALVRSKHLPALRHLQVHMTTFGDEGVEAVLGRGILKRLKTLDLGYGNITDDGAKALAACPDLKNLDALDVSCNALTKRGVQALRKAFPHVAAGDQHKADDESYLYDVDWE
jgi:uncharacterized protein (TIGR02996 family)